MSHYHTSSPLVSREAYQNVCVIRMNNPPANTLSYDMLLQLRYELNKAMEDDTVEAVLLTGNKDFFSSGADLKALDMNYHKYGPSKSTALYVEAYRTGENLAPMVYSLDQASKPIIALVGGVAYGGGFELALGCHYRICLTSASFKLPEVFVGIIPGALGTQFLPRLVDFQTCIDIAVLGKTLTAADAFKIAIVDKILPLSQKSDDNFDSSISAAVNIVQTILGDPARAKTAFRRISGESVKTPLVDALVLSHLACSRLPLVNKGGLAQRAVLESLVACVQAGDAFIRGVLWESEISRVIVASREAHALRYVFLSERSSGHILTSTPDIGGGKHESLSIKIIGVVGSGLMGIGIAASFCQAKYTVLIIDSNQEALERGQLALAGILTSIAKKRQGSGSRNKDDFLRNVSFSTDFQALHICDMVIEAVFENLSVKREVFHKLSDICKDDCILCSNTSSLDIDAIGNGCKFPSRIAGMHFFSPAHIMKLVEVVRGKETSDAVMRAICTMSRKMQKTGIVVKNLPGFVGNRMIFNYVLESMLLLEEGVSIHRIDNLMVDFGFPMGPFQMQDLAGLDVGYKVRLENGLVSEDGSILSGLRYSSIGDKLYKLGRLGCKNGRGFYKYESGSRIPLPDEEVEELIRSHVMVPKEDIIVTDEEIMERLLYPLINEGFKVLSDRGVVSGRPGDIDIIFIMGYGWPAYKGGVMFYAQNTPGLHAVSIALSRYAKRFPSSPYFVPSSLLMAMIKKNITIFDIQRDPLLLDSILIDQEESLGSHEGVRSRL
jgi:3-hydroxyacyl-CoA dehydrogenase/enoyl-CoA hydratase/carnithine racemase